MSRFEDHLQRAANEVRELAGQQVRKPLPRPERRPRGILVFAAAFTVAMLLGLIPIFVGGEEQIPAGTTLGAPSTTLGAPSTTLAPTTTAPEVSCSSTGVPVPTPPQGIPGPVADKFTAIAQAAASCDFAVLEQLAGDRFTADFGGGGSEKLEFWETEGTGRLGTMLQVMAMSHSSREVSGDTIYFWPAAFGYEDWEEVPEAEVEELFVIYDQEDLDWMAEFGGYAGWRLGIAEDGEWLYFVAGD